MARHPFIQVHSKHFSLLGTAWPNDCRPRPTRLTLQLQLDGHRRQQLLLCEHHFSQVVLVVQRRLLRPNQPARLLLAALLALLPLP